MHYSPNNVCKNRVFFPHIFRLLRENGISSTQILGLEPTVSSFKRKLIDIIRPEKRSTIKVSDLNSVKLLTRLRVKFSDVREHKFGHNFYVTPMK